MFVSITSRPTGARPLRLRIRQYKQSDTFHVLKHLAKKRQQGSPALSSSKKKVKTAELDMTTQERTFCRELVATLLIVTCVPQNAMDVKSEQPGPPQDASDDTVAFKQKFYTLRPENANLFLYRTAVMAVIKASD